MVAAICNVQQYNAPIAELRQEEKKLIHEANHTHKNGELMVLNVKYQHINYELKGQIEDQKGCAYVQEAIENQKAKSANHKNK